MAKISTHKIILISMAFIIHENIPTIKSSLHQIIQSIAVLHNPRDLTIDIRQPTTVQAQVSS